MGGYVNDLTTNVQSPYVKKGFVRNERIRKVGFVPIITSVQTIDAVTGKWINIYTNDRKALSFKLCPTLSSQVP